MQKKKKNKGIEMDAARSSTKIIYDVVSESTVAYQRSPSRFSSKVNLHLIEEEPQSFINYKEFHKIFIQLPFDLSEWAKFLGISERTLQRYEISNGEFSILQTERVFHIKELFDLFSTVISKNKNAFYLWMTTQAFSLNGQKPIELLTSYKGTEKCMAILQNTMYGGVA
jgi:putative toxin-antitoxin system antitoxin component (TIGR02293 family)